MKPRKTRNTRTNDVDRPSRALFRQVSAEWADGQLQDGAGQPFRTGAYASANPGDYAGSAPAMLAEAVDRLATAYHALTGNPVP